MNFEIRFSFQQLINISKDKVDVNSKATTYFAEIHFIILVQLFQYIFLFLSFFASLHSKPALVL